MFFVLSFFFLFSARSLRLFSLCTQKSRKLLTLVLEMNRSGVSILWIFGTRQPVVGTEMKSLLHFLYPKGREALRFKPYHSWLGSKCFPPFVDFPQFIAENSSRRRKLVQPALFFFRIQAVG